jgi:ribose/xylose/arabinose/galactoside ABC-type transport system permease subunit
MLPKDHATDAKAEVDKQDGTGMNPPAFPDLSDHADGLAPDHSWARVGLSKAGPWAIPALAVILYIGFSIAAPHTFASFANLRAMIGGQAVVLLLAMAVIFPMRAGDFDLSVSAVMILTGCAVGVLTEHHVTPVLACLLAVLIGPAVGAINGILVVRMGIDGLIATLGTLTIMGELRSWSAATAQSRRSRPG